MALPKMQRVFAAAAVAALLMAGAPGRAEAAGNDVAAGLSNALSSLWAWAVEQARGGTPGPPQGPGENEGTNGNGHGRGRPAWVPGPPDVDKGSGLDPNGGDGGE